MNAGGRPRQTDLAYLRAGITLARTSAGFPAQAAYDRGSLGFTAGAYINAVGEIVIAYKGTDFLLDEGCEVKRWPICCPMPAWRWG
jgi:hypothetical protein